MEYRKKDLQKAAFCQTRLKYDFGGEETKSAETMPLTVYSIVTETIKGLLRGEFDDTEVHDVIDSAGQLSELPEEDRAIKRSCETMVSNWQAFYFGRKPIIVNDDRVRVTLPYVDGEALTRPDVVYDNGQTIEVVYIKTGSAYKMADEFLPSMYNGILYGRTLVPDGESRQIICTYAEVKKAKKQSITDDIWPLPEGINSELDDKAKAEFEELSQGSECEGTDCRYCPGRFECQYQAPALALDVEKVMKPKKVILSDAQKLVQAFGA